MAEFNFLPPTKVESNETILRRRRYANYSFFGIALFLILGLIFGGVNFIQHRRIEDLQNRKEALNSLLAGEQSKIDLLTKVHRKVAGIKYILSSQFDYSNGFRDFFQLLPSGVSADSVTISSDGKLEAQLIASGSGALKDLVPKVTNSSAKYTLIKIGDIKAEEKGGYTLELEFVTPKKI